MSKRANKGKSVNVVIGDSIRAHTFDILKVSNQSIRSVNKLLRDVEQELTAELLRQTPSTLNKSRRMNEFLDGATETINAGYRKIGTALSGELAELAEISTIFAGKNINSAVGVGVIDTFLTRKQTELIASDLMIAGAPSEEWWSRQSAITADAFKDQVRLGMASGDTIQQLAQRIRGGTRDGAIVPGVAEVRGVTAPGRGFLTRPMKNAKALVRTSFMTVANETHRKTYEANQDVLQGTQQISTLDGRTTLICIAYSGACWDFSGKPINGTTLPYNGGCPRHWGCRSVEIPLLLPLSELLGIPGLDDIPDSTRSSIDGQIPADTTFDKWLGGKDESFQDDLLGTRRADLWRNGEIDLTDLVSPDTGEVRTLAELSEDVSG